MLTAKLSKRLQMLKHNCKTLPMLKNTIKRLLCSSTQARTSNQTELQRKMFDTEHLIYNQRCSQYKSDTDSLRL